MCGKQNSHELSGFMSLHKTGSIGGCLSSMVKILINLVIGNTDRFDGFIANHVLDELILFATWGEAIETIAVAILGSGGPEKVRGLQVLIPLEKLETYSL
jgi:hypothetical protein